MTQITDHLADIRERVAHATRAAKSPREVMIVAVGKGQPAEAIAAAFDVGQKHFGESYLQEAAPKIAALAGRDIVWHFIGRMQSNKTRPVAELFSWVHTLDREKIAQRLNEQRPHHAAPLNVLIQVNQADEPQKGGVPEREVAALARAVARMPRLRLRGLMTVPPQHDAASTAAWFEQLAQLYAELRSSGLPLDTLSMGMSADFETAIANGSNCVRIGTAIFGPRGNRA